MSDAIDTKKRDSLKKVGESGWLPSSSRSIGALSLTFPSRKREMIDTAAFLLPGAYSSGIESSEYWEVLKVRMCFRCLISHSLQFDALQRAFQQSPQGRIQSCNENHFSHSHFHQCNNFCQWRKSWASQNHHHFSPSDLRNWVISSTDLFSLFELSNGMTQHQRVGFSTCYFHAFRTRTRADSKIREETLFIIVSFSRPCTFTL